MWFRIVLIHPIYTWVSDGGTLHFTPSTAQSYQNEINTLSRNGDPLADTGS